MEEKCNNCICIKCFRNGCSDTSPNKTIDIINSCKTCYNGCMWSTKQCVVFEGETK